MSPDTDKEKKVRRSVVYSLGLFLLALGIMLNTKTGLGVSPIASIPYSISQIFSLDFGNVTLIIYMIFVAGQYLIRRDPGRVHDLLQIPLSILFTRILNFFNQYLPQAKGRYVPVIFLALAILCTGTGAYMTVWAKLIPNPADGLVAAISDVSKKKIGIVKNIFDACNLLVTLLICMIFAGKLYGIGPGTIATALGVGWVMHQIQKITERSWPRVRQAEEMDKNACHEVNSK